MIKKKAKKRTKSKSSREEMIEICIDDDQEKFEESLAPPLPSFTANDDPEFSVTTEVVIDVEPRGSKRPRR